MACHKLINKLKRAAYKSRVKSHLHDFSSYLPFVY
jgi:hypothetical protein